MGLRFVGRPPVISHLLFIDDSLLFYRARLVEAQKLKVILKAYEDASGQAINFSKSSMSFNHMVSEEDILVIKEVLGI